MGGFSADWLRLREPADHRARAAALGAEVEAAFAAHPSLTVTDLGCGSGSNLRGLAPRLGPVQHWRLVDHDAALLAAAAEALLDWAGPGGGTRLPDGGLELRLDGRQVTVSFLQADLAEGVEAVLDLPADLVTAAAFFDLVSPAWIDRFAEAATARHRPLYTVLTYDGTEHWQPPHPADAAILSAFHAHQASNKGFGPAAGPAATGLLQAAFAARGWRVDAEPSPWRLGSAEAGLIQALAEGAAQAVAETGRVAADVVSDWRSARRTAAACTIGHVDLFARP